MTKVEGSPFVSLSISCVPQTIWCHRLFVQTLLDRSLSTNDLLEPAVRDTRTRSGLFFAQESHNLFDVSPKCHLHLFSFLLSRNAICRCNQNWLGRYFTLEFVLVEMSRFQLLADGATIYFEKSKWETGFLSYFFFFPKSHTCSRNTEKTTTRCDGQMTSCRQVGRENTNNTLMAVGKAEEQQSRNTSVSHQGSTLSDGWLLRTIPLFQGVDATHGSARTTS